MSLKLNVLAVAIAAVTALPAFAIEAVTTSNLNVRSCASTTCRVIDVLREGDSVDVRYCNTSKWCAIDQRRGPSGFVNANYLARADYGDDEEYYDDSDSHDGYYDDGYYDDEDSFYIVRPDRPRRVIRRVDPYFSACVGGPNAQLCLY